MILHHPTRALHSCTILRQIAQFAQKDWQNLLNFFSKIFHTCCEFCAREWYTSIHERRGEWRSLQTENRRVRDMTNDKDTKDAASAAATKKPSASAVEALIAKAKERSQAAAPVDDLRTGEAPAQRLMSGKSAALRIITAVVEFAVCRPEPERHAPALPCTRLLRQIIAIQRYAGRGPPALAIDA